MDREKDEHPERAVVSLPRAVAGVLPAETARAWRALAGRLPTDLYLGGGTALAVRIRHRTSRDLDFFFHHSSVDLVEVEDLIGHLGAFAVTDRAPGTLNGVFEGAKLQFLHADEVRPQHRLDPLDPTAGLIIGGMRDLVAMKLQAIGGRGEMRDYFDLMSVEERTPVRMEEGLTWWLARYRPTDEAQQLRAVVRALGYMEDIADDPLLPDGAASRVRSHWAERGPELLSALSRY